MKKRPRLLSAITALLILAFAGCATPSSPSTSQGPTPRENLPPIEATVAEAQAARAETYAESARLATTTQGGPIRGLPAGSGSHGWWATTWSQTDGNGFYGMPTSTSSSNSTIIIRYTHYTTDYDAAFRAPIWGAYTIDATGVMNEFEGLRPASNDDFKRPKFFADPLVIALSQRLGVPYAVHETFGDAVVPGFPFADPQPATPEKARARAQIVERGHMVANNAMKSVGTYEQGRVSQKESFSLANVAVQMSQNNAPVWSALEDRCFDWASELGQVWVVAGPIFKNRAHPVYAHKWPTGEKLMLPVPDAFYCVVIGKRNGRPSAVGFIVPHTDKNIKFRDYAKPVRVVQQQTGLDFMPELGAAVGVEDTVDVAWENAPKRPKKKE